MLDFRDNLRRVLENHWYLVHGQAGSEAVAEAGLNRQGFETFLPISVRTVRHARQTRTVWSASFPAYLFVSFEIERQPWQSISGTRAVVRLVSSIDCPRPVPAGLVDSVKSACSEHGVIRSGLALTAGQVVKLAAGPFEDMVDRIDGLAGADQVRVHLEVMNPIVAIEAPIYACVAA